MKKLGWIFIVALTLGYVQISCVDHKPKSSEQMVQEEHAAFVKELTSEDTVEMIKICNDCMNTLKSGRIDDAMKMFHLITPDGELKPLSQEKERQLRKNFKFFPVIDYKLDYFSFNTSGVNDVKYTIEFFEKKDGDATPNTINFMFNPVKKSRKWYITVKEADQSVDGTKF